MLSKNWITEHSLDVEYKQLLFLNYIQKVECNFKQKKIYPYLYETREQFEYLTKIKNERDRMMYAVNTTFSGFDFEKNKLKYSVNKKNEKVFESIDKIIEFSIPVLKNTIQYGEEIKSELENSVHIYTLGIMPLYKNEGILILDLQKIKRAFVFEYELNRFDSGIGYLNIKTSFIKTYSINFFNSLHSIKLDIIKKYKKIPVPATYVVEAEIFLPLKDAMLPIAAQKLKNELVKAF